jgi:hypothetical protein
MPATPRDWVAGSHHGRGCSLGVRLHRPAAPALAPSALESISSLAGCVPARAGLPYRAVPVWASPDARAPRCSAWLAGTLYLHTFQYEVHDGGEDAGSGGEASMLDPERGRARTSERARETETTCKGKSKSTDPGSPTGGQLHRRGSLVACQVQLTRDRLQRRTTAA